VLALAATAAVVLASGPAPGSGEPVEMPVESMSLRCGYDVDVAFGQAFYTHCDERTRVAVYINYRVGGIGEKCFGPGTHSLGSTDIVEFAYYAGRLC
jgi:hypothetical protein